MQDIEIKKTIPDNKKNLKEIVWQAPAFRYYAKGVSWYWLSLIVAILLLAFAVWQENFLFAVFVFLAEITVFVWARRQPALIKFKIDEKGVTVAGRIYPYEELEKFCLRSDRESKNFDELILKKKTHLNPYLKIFIESRLAPGAQEILNQKLTEEKYEDSLLEGFLKWLRF
jgi:hypothetical protein